MMHTNTAMTSSPPTTLHVMINTSANKKQEKKKKFKFANDGLNANFDNHVDLNQW
jgi:hypothetical protein